MKKTLLLLSSLILLFGTTLFAQTKKSNYLYLEINKNLPVSVKLNNKNIRNNHKGYIIIPKLASGTNTIAFNFKNPNFRNHTFKIDGSNRSMGLKLMRVSGNRFVLQDVVNKRIINDQTMLSAAPIAIVEKGKEVEEKVKIVAKTETPKRGVIKVYQDIDSDKAAKKKVVRKKKKAKKVKKTSTIKKSTKVVSTSPPSKPRALAMYKDRKPLTTKEREARYKDYSKLKRAKKRAERLRKLNQETAITKKEDDRKKVGIGSIIPKETKESNTKNEKNLRKEAKRIAREKKKKELLAQEKEDEARLVKEREERRLKRIAKRKKRELAAIEAESDRVPPTKKKSKRKKESSKEKIINAEPIGNGPGSPSTIRSISENELSPIRCKGTVKADKVAEWTLKLHKKFDDEARSNYIKRKLGNKCISSNTLGAVLGNLDTQIGRYKLIRTLYPQLEDPSNIDRFNKYFQSKSFVDKLKELKTNNY